MHTFRKRALESESICCRVIVCIYTVPSVCICTWMCACLMYGWVNVYEWDERVMVFAFTRVKSLFTLCMYLYVDVCVRVCVCVCVCVWYIHIYLVIEICCGGWSRWMTRVYHRAPSHEACITVGRIRVTTLLQGSFCMHEACITIGLTHTHTRSFASLRTIVLTGDLRQLRPTLLAFWIRNAWDISARNSTGLCWYVDMYGAMLICWYVRGSWIYLT